MIDIFAVVTISRESDAARLVAWNIYREPADEIALKAARKVRNEDVFVCRAIAKVEVLNADDAWKTGKRAPLKVSDMPEAKQ